MESQPVPRTSQQILCNAENRQCIPADKTIRLRIPFGISYKSDLQKVRGLAIEAGKSVDRILAEPEPPCLLREFGASTVNFELRLWISDPENGLHNVKSSVLLAVWDIFHENNIEFAFPQRDLHIKSSVSFQTSGSQGWEYSKVSSTIRSVNPEGPPGNNMADFPKGIKAKRNESCGGTYSSCLSTLTAESYIKVNIAKAHLN